jgi:hypothetical protein
MRRALRIILGRTHVVGAVDDEIVFHLRMRVRRLVAGGMMAFEEGCRANLVVEARVFVDVDSVEHLARVHAQTAPDISNARRRGLAC